MGSFGGDGGGFLILEGLEKKILVMDQNKNNDTRAGNIKRRI